MINNQNNSSPFKSSSAGASSPSPASSPQKTSAPKSKRPRKFNWKVILGVIVLVIVAVGSAAGFYITQYGNLDLRQQAAVSGGGGGGDDDCIVGQCYSQLKCVNQNGVKRLVNDGTCKASCNTAAGLLQDGQTGSGACRADGCGDGTRPQYTCNNGNAAKTCVSDGSCTSAPTCPGDRQQAVPNCPAHQQVDTQNLGNNVFCHKCVDKPKPTIAGGARCTAAQGCNCATGGSVGNGQVCPGGAISCYERIGCELKSFNTTATQTTCASFDAFDTKAQCDAGTTSEINCYNINNGCGVETLRIPGVSICRSTDGNPDAGDQYYNTKSQCEAALGDDQKVCWYFSTISNSCVSDTFSTQNLEDGECKGSVSFGGSIDVYDSAGACVQANSGGVGGGECPADVNVRATARRACLSDPFNEWDPSDCSCSKLDPQDSGDGKKSFKGCRQACNDKDGCICSTGCSNATPNGKGGYNPGEVEFTQACPDYRDEDRCRTNSPGYSSNLRACNCGGGVTVPIGFKCSAPCEDGFGNDNDGILSCAPNGNIRKCVNGVWDNLDGSSNKYGSCGGTGIDDCAPGSERDCALGKEPGDRCGNGGICQRKEPFGDGFFSSEDGQRYYGLTPDLDPAGLLQWTCSCEGETTPGTDGGETPGTGSGGTTTDTYSCDSSCTSDSQCKSGDPSLVCSNGKCRNPNYPDQPSCQPPAGPMCLNISMKDAQGNPATQPSLGQSVVFECGAVAGADHYIFRVIEPDGNIVDLTANGRNSSSYTIDQAGTYQAQCQICTGADASTCHSYEPLN